MQSYKRLSGFALLGFFCTIWLFGGAIAQTYGDDLDALLADFFGAAVTGVRVYEGDAIDEIVAEEARAEDIKSQIESAQTAERARYGDTLRAANAASAQIWRLYAQQRGAATQLAALDADRQVQKAAQAALQQQADEWRRKLAEASAMVYRTQAATRAERAEQKRALARLYARSTTAAADPVWNAAKWLLSDKTAAEIQIENHALRHVADARAGRIDQLNQAQKVLSAEEQRAALYDARLTKIKDELRQKETQLKQLADAKATLLTRLNDDEDALRAQYASYAAQLAESKKRLDQLQQAYANARPVPAKPTEKGITTEAKIEAAGRFVWPLAGGIFVTADFHDEEYKEHFGREHWGIDLRAAQGTAVLAAGDGTVAEAVDNGLGYSYVILSHAGGWFTVYGHLSQISVNPGQAVNRGEVIGLSGGTPGTQGAGPWTTGPHLHFELAKDGEYIDPASIIPLR